MKIRPLHDWTVVRRTDDAEKTAGGIIIPAVAREKRAEGIVEAVGPGKFTSRGEGKKERFVPTTVKPGQTVIFPGYSAREVDVEERTITLVREEDILGTYEGGAHQGAKEHFEAPARKPVRPEARKKTGTVKKKKKEVAKEKEKRVKKKSAAGTTKKTVKKPAAGKKPSAVRSTVRKTKEKKATPKKRAVKKKKAPAGMSRKRK